MIKKLTIAIILAFAAVYCPADLIVEWSITNDNTQAGAITSSFTSAGLQSDVPIIMGAGLTQSDFNTAQGWEIRDQTYPLGDFSGALTANDYLSFTITPDAGQEFSITNFSTSIYTRNADIYGFALLSDAYGDGFSTVRGSTTVNADGAAGTSVTFSVSGMTGLTAATEFRLALTLDTDNRFYAYGFYDVGDTSAFEVHGTVVPEPASFGIFAVGFLAVRFLRRKRRNG